MKKFIVLLMLCSTPSALWAEEARLEIVQVETSIAAIERGAESLIINCHSCHGLKYIKYRDLANFGMDKKKIEEWRGDQSLDAPIAGQMSEEAAVQSFGVVPPDLSLMTKAREGGASYVYSYLLGYYSSPDGVTGNHIYPATKMPDILGISGVTEPAAREELQKKAHDIVSFLSWAADPHEQERHRLGYYVIGYLVLMTLLLYFVKNQVWSKLK